MAITIVSDPTTHEPVYNYLNYEVTSTNSGEDNFKYIFQIYINGNLEYTQYNAPAPNASGYINIGRVVESYLTNDASTLLTNTIPRVLCPNSYVDGVQLKVGEQYMVAGVLTDYLNLTTSNTIYPFNGALNYLDRVGYVATQYIMDTGVSSNYFLTNMPSEVNVYRTQNQWLSLLRSTQDVNGMSVHFYDSNGNSLGNPLITLMNDANLNSGGRLIRVKAGLENLQDIGASHFVTPFSISAIVDQVSYYNIFIYNTTTNFRTSQVFRFNVLDRNCKYEGKEIYFQNRFGAFESFVFNLVSTSSADIEKSTYINNNAYSQLNYAITDRLKTSIGNRTKEKFTAVSDWITEDESAWLLQLMESPVVFLKYNNSLLPINITTNSYDIYTRENKKLFNIKIDYEYTFINDTQR